MSKTPTASFLAYVGEVRAQVDAALEEAIRFDDDCPDPLRQAIAHSLMAPGKRLRPLLVVMAAELCGADRGRALPAALAVEMIHTYSLIHDDLPAMDDDDMRRGRPTCHKAFGEALAILAGDGLLAQAFEILARRIEPPETATVCIAELARAAGVSCLVGGQVDDLSDHDDSDGLRELSRIHRRKTGALIAVSLRLGGLIAGASAGELEALEQYGRHLGMAFQITDDLLDVAGDASRLGKRTNKDAVRGKLTFPGLLGVEASRQRARESVDKACSALESFSGDTTHLMALAQYVLDRDH